MGRVLRPAEDAVLQALRRELEPHGFRYKARKLIRELDSWRVIVCLFRARWIEPTDEIFTVLLEFNGRCSTTGEEGATTLSLADATRGGLFYGQSGLIDEPAPVDPNSVVEEFRRYLLPVAVEHGSPQSFAEALLAGELAPGVAHYLPELDRAHQAYAWAECLGDDDIAAHAIALMREVARRPDERDAVVFAWQTLNIPGSPI